MENDPKLALSSRADQDIPPDTNPESKFWHEAPSIYLTSDCYGKAVARHKSEVRSRWTAQNLYFLFLCPYEELHLKPDPSIAAKTWGLWNWDVAEAFIGSTGDPIDHYKEFEMSPQGEWLDLSVDLHRTDKIADHSWQSGFKVAARLDLAAKVWYGCMQIPFAALGQGPAKAGDTLRINFFRSQGPLPRELAWQPPQQESFHAPERFGKLRLIP